MRVWGRDTYSATPLVAVEREEVDIIRRVATTGEIVLQHRPKLSNIGSAISDRYLTVVLGGPVCLEISRSSLDVGSSLALTFLVDDLVAHKKAQSIVVLDKLVHDRRERSQLSFIPVRGLLDRGGWMSAHA